ncbi:MAG: hypothetical protein ACXABY_35700 [Candidatus Thorarchaeota archaeon]|jgi:hypothetical protein
MPVTLEDVRKSSINEEHCERVEQRMLDILNNSDLNLRELVFVLAQILIDTGGTLEKVGDKLTYNDMWRRYATEPTLGNALMAQGTDILHDWLKIPEKDSG